MDASSATAPDTIVAAVADRVHRNKKTARSVVSLLASAHAEWLKNALAFSPYANAFLGDVSGWEDK